MATDIKKIITPDQKMQALGLFTMATSHYGKAREFEELLGQLLGYPEEDGNYLGCISDEMQDGGNFTRGLKREGFETKAPLKPTKKPRGDQ